MRHETIAMEVSPLEFEGIRVVDFEAQVDAKYWNTHQGGSQGTDDLCGFHVKPGNSNYGKFP